MRVASNLKRGVAVLVMLGALAACNPNAQDPNNPNNPNGPNQPGPFAQGPGQPNTNPGANGWPPMQPTPGQPNQPGWPGNPGQPGQPGYPNQPNQPGQYPQQPGYPNQPGQYPSQPGGQLQARAPQGMQPLQSPAGAVFQTTMNGSRSASQLGQAVVQSLQQGYFDRPPQIMGAMNDPSDMFGQIGFQTTMQGRPVMGIIAVMSDGQNGGRAYLMFDSAERFNQTAPVMMNAVQQHAGMGGGGGNNGYPGQY